jgi:hypothetical protein
VASGEGGAPEAAMASEEEEDTFALLHTRERERNGKKMTTTMADLHQEPSDFSSGSGSDPNSDSDAAAIGEDEEEAQTPHRQSIFLDPTKGLHFSSPLLSLQAVQREPLPHPAIRSATGSSSDREVLGMAEPSADSVHILPHVCARDTRCCAAWSEQPTESRASSALFLACRHQHDIILRFMVVFLIEKQIQ